MIVHRDDARTLGLVRAELTAAIHALEQVQDYPGKWGVIAELQRAADDLQAELEARAERAR